MQASIPSRSLTSRSRLNLVNHYWKISQFFSGTHAHDRLVQHPFEESLMVPVAAFKGCCGAEVSQGITVLGQWEFCLWF